MSPPLQVSLLQAMVTPNGPPPLPPLPPVDVAPPAPPTPLEEAELELLEELLEEAELELLEELLEDAELELLEEAELELLDEEVVALPPAPPEPEPFTKKSRKASLRDPQPTNIAVAAAVSSTPQTNDPWRITAGAYTLRRLLGHSRDQTAIDRAEGGDGALHGSEHA